MWLPPLETHGSPISARGPVRDVTFVNMSEGRNPMNITYSVPGMTRDHCRVAIASEVTAVDGVESVDVDLDTKLVRISGDDLDGATLVAAIDEAGYEATRA